MAATITKLSTVHLDTVTLTAGAAAMSSTIQDLTGIDTATVDLRITNLSTGPTAPGQFQIETSPDNGTNYFDFGGPLVSLTGNAPVLTEWSGIQLPPGCMYVRITAGSNTIQNVTARAVVNTYKKL